MNQQRFLGDESLGYSPLRVSVIPAPMGATLSWLGGADRGPEAFLAASTALETFDDELLQETVACGIDTLPALDLEGLPQEESLARICAAVGSELDRGRLPLLVGGEHTVSLGGIAAAARRFPDLSVLQFDAHLDLRDRYDSTPLSHACVMRRVSDLALPFVQVGIRSFSAEEHEFVRARERRFFTPADCRRPGITEKICSVLAGPVYITFDVDVLDPAIMPATGTPEPDGLDWNQALDILREVCRRKKVVGLDFVELSPRPGTEHAAFTVAKIAYRTLGYIFHESVTANES